MKRHPALQDYSRDHHFLLLQTREIRWFFDESRHAAQLEQLSAGFLSAWRRDIGPHLQEEEAVLLPFYAQHDAADEAYLQRVYSEHAWLRENVLAFQERLEQDEDFLELLGQIGHRLHDHVRFEERVLFQHMQSLLSDAELADLDARSRAYRERHRPEAIGPRDEWCDLGDDVL
ncbi:MAG: hemerythrin domain-containing protein [Chloroflexota bacterium]|nr:hemerythrin domain-containing protein [Chloroflexota bacterium]